MAATPLSFRGSNKLRELCFFVRLFFFVCSNLLLRCFPGTVDLTLCRHARRESGGRDDEHDER